MATVSAIIAGTYDYLGRPTQDKLSLGTVLPFLLDAIDYYNIDLQLSSENWLLKSYTYTPTAKDAVLQVTDADFSVPVAVEVRDANSDDDGDWQGVLIANVTDIQDIGRDGTKAVGFYGTPTRIVYSWDPSATGDWAAGTKLWYEPIGPSPATLNDSPTLSSAFHTMLKLRTALMCIPYVKGLEAGEGIAKILTAQLLGWERKWKIWTEIDRNARPIQKRDFRGSRAGWRSGGWF